METREADPQTRHWLHCGEPLRPCRDMWGPFYICEECGFATETEEEAEMSHIRELIDLPALIYEEGEPAVDVCYGPENDGKCPRALAGAPVACAGRWLRARGWNFAVADDARICPLAALGVVRLPYAGESNASRTAS